jgi:2'-5' RNA ligase
MKRRIFIAINLPEDIKNKLTAYQREWADLPIRFTKKDSLHLTIVFIGYVTDDEMLDICRNVQRIAKKHRPFDLKFQKICLGPPARIATPARHADGSHAGWRSVAGGPAKPPRLIWLEGEKSDNLFRLKQDLEAAVFPRGAREYDDRSDKNFLPHITLARIRQMEWKNLSLQPVIDQTISIEVPVESIEVMESNLQRDGAEYAVLESAELGGVRHQEM